MFNLAFVPLVYFLYPETANRTLEDLDAYYRDSPSLLVFKDRDVTGTKRPQRFIDEQHENVRRASSVDASEFRRRSTLAAQGRRMSKASTVQGGQQIEKDGNMHLDAGDRV